MKDKIYDELLVQCLVVFHNWTEGTARKRVHKYLQSLPPATKEGLHHETPFIVANWLSNEDLDSVENYEAYEKLRITVRDRIAREQKTEERLERVTKFVLGQLPGTAIVYSSAALARSFCVAAEMFTPEAQSKQADAISAQLDKFARKGFKIPKEQTSSILPTET
ncbi:MAG: hypothetical protein K2W95_32795 [Candidatus Obscuribacterales bacterium]|nr:hypothetical protein [Candidatus Obscuribacterales bacterium]